MRTRDSGRRDKHVDVGAIETSLACGGDLTLKLGVNLDSAIPGLDHLWCVSASNKNDNRDDAPKRKSASKAIRLQGLSCIG